MPDKAAIERLEAVVEIDKQSRQLRQELDRKLHELREVKSELKALKALDPIRMKKNLADLKKKLVVKNAEIQAQSKELLGLRRTLREAKSELNASQNETDAFYVSACKQWELFFTGFRYPNEKADPDSARVRCLDRRTGTSVVAEAINDKEVRWSWDIGIPDDVSDKAAETILRLKLPSSPSDK